MYPKERRKKSIISIKRNGHVPCQWLTRKECRLSHLFFMTSVHCVSLMGISYFKDSQLPHFEFRSCYCLIIIIINHIYNAPNTLFLGAVVLLSQQPLSEAISLHEIKPGRQHHKYTILISTQLYSMLCYVTKSN